MRRAKSDVPAFDLEDEHGRTPLFIAVHEWDVTRVRDLLARGADPFARPSALATCRAYEKLGDADDGPRGHATLLHGFASGAAYPRGSDAPGVLAALVACGLEIDARNRDGSTPLHVAVQHARREAPPLEHDAVAALLAHGSDVHGRDRRGSTPLAHASSVWTLRRLLDAGANPDDGTLTSQGLDELGVLLDAGADPRRQPWALGMAARAGKLDVVRLLLSHGAPTERVNGGHRSSIVEEAITAMPTDVHVEIVELLLEAGATLLGSALVCAAGAGHAGLVELLLPRRTDEDLAEVLTAGARAGSLPVVARLLHEGAPASGAALCAAAGAGSVETIAALLAAGAPVDARDEHGDSALVLAAKARSADGVRALLRAGADAKRVAGKLARLLPEIAAEVPRSTPRGPAPVLQVGDAVVHDTFGDGRVVRLDGSACIVAFSDGLEHRLASRFVRRV